ncbi:hypothetical protein DFJ74DRAFT_707542 [Hyaloraphidium curvatum]|nr:hypothetical protein DFJ74DRAFT_707542 [Hyaloraphidium curvatum]
MSLTGLLAAYGSEDEDERSSDDDSGRAEGRSGAASAAAKRAADGTGPHAPEKKRQRVKIELAPKPSTSDDEGGPTSNQRIGKATSIFSALPAPTKSSAAPPLALAETTLGARKESDPQDSDLRMPRVVAAPRTVKASANRTPTASNASKAPGFFGSLGASEDVVADVDFGPARPPAGGYFSFGGDEPEERAGHEEEAGAGDTGVPAASSTEASSQGDVYTGYDYSYEQYAQLYGQEEYGMPTEPGDEFDEEQLRRIHGRNISSAQFKEVRQSEQTRKTIWEAELAKEMANAARPLANPFGHTESNSKYKKRNGILTLAHDARVREMELKEQYAARRMAKKAAGAQYGF